MVANKIYIVGGPGAGKSTLARTLADRIRTPIHDLDLVLWRNGGAKSETERQDEMAKIDATGTWVAEGIYTQSAQYLIERADVALWIEVPLPVAVWRIVARHVRRSLAGENMYPGVWRLFKFIWRGVVKYHLGDRPDRAPLGLERRRHTRRYLESFVPKVIGPSPSDVRRWMAKSPEPS